MKSHLSGSPKICVIGAGPCGITTAKNLLQQGLTNLTVFEKSTRLGGNWVFDEQEGHSSVYETTHIISSKYLSEFEDFVMPLGYSEYPSHSKMLHYFDVYAEKFGVKPFVRFNTRVENIIAVGKQWQVFYQDATGLQEEFFDFVFIANGHHWDPVMPEPAIFQGFQGEILHSHQYKKAEPFKNKRVLVVGGGNSACDVAVEVSRVAERACISMRRGQHILPKFIFGKPTDIAFAKLNWLPFSCKQWLATGILRLVQGKYKKYRLQKPDCKLLAVHPTINSELLYSIRHGKVYPYQGIVRTEGNTVYFANDRQEDFDIIICATGYRINFPFLSKDVADFSGLSSIPLYRKMMHPQFENLYFIGLFQPQGCIWPLADYQAKIAACIIKGSLKRPNNLIKKIEKESQKTRKRFKNNVRHALEVDYHIFRKQLRAELKKVEKV